MKKLLIILVIVCVVFAAAVGIISSREAQNPELPQTPADVQTTSAPEAVPSALPAEEAAPINVQELDFDKMYALHDPSEIVMNIGGEDVTWSEYFSWLKMNGTSIQNYMKAMAVYGADIRWEDSMSDNLSFAEYIPISAENAITENIAIDKAAEARGYVRDETYEELLSAQMKSDIATMCGDGATEEDLYAALAEKEGMSRECYERAASANAVYAAAFYYLYGEELEKVDDADVLDYLEEKGYIYANHILFMMKDPATNEALDDAAKETKLEQVQEVYAELSGIKDEQALVARFKALKEQYCEDSGKAAYPDGYVFTAGTMTPEFEDACLALEPYGVSEPVESDYGYHIIIRLPLDPEAVMGYNNDGSTYNARNEFVNKDYNGFIAAVIASLETVYADGFTGVNVCDFIK